MSAIFFIDLINDCCKDNLTLAQSFSIPYHKIYKATKIARDMRDIDRGILFNFILGNQKTNFILRSLKKSGLLKHLFKDIDDLSQIPQKKRKAKDVFQHTVNVINRVPVDNYQLRWAALLHDIGKYDTWNKSKNFKRHEIYSHRRSIHILDKYRVVGGDKILKVILHHMYPLEYQRNPVWKEDSIVKFIDTCGTKHVLSVIEFSIYDKLAEQNEKTTEPLIFLIEKVKTILYERYKILSGNNQIALGK